MQQSHIWALTGIFRKNCMKLSKSERLFYQPLAAWSYGGQCPSCCSWDLLLHLNHLNHPNLPYHPNHPWNTGIPNPVVIHWFWWIKSKWKQNIANSASPVKVYIFGSSSTFWQTLCKDRNFSPFSFDESFLPDCYNCRSVPRTDWLCFAFPICINFISPIWSKIKKFSHLHDFRLLAIWWSWPKMGK